MKLKTRDMILIALFTALTAIGGFLKIPTPVVPFTLQVFFCVYAGIFLGSRKGMLSQLLYVLIGLGGVPVFTEGGGFAYIFKPTFGYILGFILCAYITGKVTESFKELKFTNIFIASFVGLASVYVIGVPYLYLMINRVAETPITFSAAIKMGLVPFLVHDLIKCIIVTVTAAKILPVLGRLGYITKKA
ncbi:putative biotin biosynthesis protein BioY [Proteiniborus sp. DW1]|uniref:biotin transporter BioY n=1 Tax=Proteiniborus sp. DW1 TaxID=1889883 RepID=UPI00092DF974|nr:biotin transporter BioY [Proteiniborus sp. DW1]SCG82806.1 putative biotin biosynthesis protein BioY [Proteiniborus sp. DW1]